MSVTSAFAALYWVWIACEFLLQIVTRTNRSSGEVKDRGSLLVLLPAIFLSLWAAMQYAATHPPTMFSGAPWLRTLGLLLMIAGLCLRGTAVYSLGRSFSTNVAIHRTQTLNRTGLYRLVRHPSYTGMLLIFAAIGIFERNWISLAILLLFPTAALLYRIHVEEIALHAAFGADYLEYSSVTKRLIPGIY